jgi:hypothetical protein
MVDKKYKVRIKQVPDQEPNADGEWIEKEITPLTKMILDLWKSVRWEKLSSLCDVGHHAVQYEYD